MTLDWGKLNSILDQKDGNGSYRSVVKGDETDDQLRAIALQLGNYCPIHSCTMHCPFALLASLGSEGLAREIKRMKRQTLLDLFQMELDCRTEVFQSPLAARRFN